MAFRAVLEGAMRVRLLLPGGKTRPDLISICRQRDTCEQKCPCNAGIAVRKCEVGRLLEAHLKCIVGEHDLRP